MGITDVVFDRELITTTIEEQKRPVKPIIHLYVLVAWDHQGEPMESQPTCASESERLNFIPLSAFSTFFKIYIHRLAKLQLMAERKSGGDWWGDKGRRGGGEECPLV